MLRHAVIPFSLNRNILKPYYKNFHHTGTQLRKLTLTPNATSSVSPMKKEPIVKQENAPSTTTTNRVILSIRAKTLRLHDNPALHHALSLNPSALYVVFCFDPFYVFKIRAGVRRWKFLLDSMHDFDAHLRDLGSRLVVTRGDPTLVFPRLFEDWGITHYVYEKDTEPYPVERDAKMDEVAREAGVEVAPVLGHTIWDPAEVCRAHNGKAPLTYGAFMKTLQKMPQPAAAVPPPTVIPSCGELEVPHPPDGVKYKVGEVPTRDHVHKRTRSMMFTEFSGPNKNFDVPTMEELGLSHPDPQSPHQGGETEALRRLDEYLRDAMKVVKFEKPKTSPAAFTPASTTVLSPYLKFGCLSSRYFRERIMALLAEHPPGIASRPPVSLLGQLYWREFYYTVASTTVNYDKMQGNPISLQVGWRCRDGPEDPDDPQAGKDLRAFSDAKTGFPWIDAIMTQLRIEGWIHHLARHSVACFLTRGNLYISWERGAEIFEELLIDHDWSLNVGNWLWLSASAFFSAYFRIYSPISFGKKYDSTGKYVRKYLPVLKDMPKEFIYEPWKAPLAVQKKAKCIVGKDYPAPIVDHEESRARCLEAMKRAYADGHKGVPGDFANDSKEVLGDLPILEDDEEEKSDEEEQVTKDEFKDDAVAMEALERIDEIKREGGDGESVSARSAESSGAHVPAKKRKIDDYFSSAAGPSMKKRT